MSGLDYPAWAAQVLAKAEQRPILFLQLGAGHEPARRALLESGVTVAPLTKYIRDDSPESGTIAISELEMIVQQGLDSQMGVLRERVFADVTKGLRVVLVSRAPRIAYPPVAGSSLLEDVSLVHAPALTGVAPEHMPTCLEDGAEPETVLRSVLKELGPEVCASLDRVLYESLLIGQDALDSLKAREIEALDGAGLTCSTRESRSWNFPTHLVPLKNALAETLAEEVDPQEQLGAVSQGLWKIERVIRRAVRDRAIQSWGKQWRDRCLNGDLPTKVLERAGESAYLGVTSVKQLRDPLEWLSLGELLGLLDRPEIGDLGMGAPFWRRFRAEVLPIRNQLAHMRMLHTEDSTDIIKWRRILELKLPASRR
ncbi:hypothetical protein ACF1AJ_17605 [Leifsonia sp. NPDC014704]|uniref:hypothetical protein n=1 Tax=Leifsonia sp. NPDC014704 TaxID=3364123 RepID=UPI0036F46C6B